MDGHSSQFATSFTLKRKFPPEDHAPPFSDAHDGPPTLNDDLDSSNTTARNTTIASENSVKVEPSDAVKEGNVNNNESGNAAATAANGGPVTVVVKEETFKSIFTDIMQTKQMDTLRFLTVKYGGNWINCDYVGGGEQTTNIPPEHVSIVNLRNNINNILQLNSLSTEYELYCLSRSTNGQTQKCLLTSDEQLGQLFIEETFPVVHVIPSCAVGTLQGDCCSPSSDMNEMLQGEPTVPNPDSTYVEEDDDNDEDHLLESESDASEDQSQENLKRSTLVEYAAWIHKEDGMARVLDLVHPSQHQKDGEEKASLDRVELTNWLVPVIPLNASASLVARENDPTKEELAEGVYYNTKEDLNIAMGMWHMEQGVEYAVDRSSNKRLVWRCKTSKKCSFVLRATRHGNIWAVHKLNRVHTCVKEPGFIAPRKVNVKVIAAHFARKMRSNCNIIKPKAIVDELLRDFGINIKYNLALRARHTALEMIYGVYGESFQMLPGYLHMLETQNPGTMTDLDVGDDGTFQHLFVALAASRLAYPLVLRPVIVLDGTLLKGKNMGILFVAVTKDANEQIYPLAYGVGTIENDVSWTWFLTRVRRAFECKPNTLIVSDSQASIANAVREVFPDATHGLCHYHLLNKIGHWGKFIAGLYQRAAYAYRPAEYERFMATINADKPAAYEKLMCVGPEKWARSKCPVRRYSFLTSNAAETFNASLLWARRLPICSMIEAIRHVIEQWFDERREAANRGEDQLSEEAAKKLTGEMTKAETYNAVCIAGKSFKVHDGIGGRSYMVDLGSHSCDCREFDLDGIPCAHAIAAIEKNGETVSEYVEAYYTRTSLIESYKHQINRVPHRDDWVIPEDVVNRRVLPPTIVPRVRRLQSAGERSIKRVPANKEEAPPGSRRRAPKKCSRCRMPGHTRNSCPDREDKD